MAFCKYCGSSIPDKAEFCPECGKKTTAVVHAAQPVTTDDKPSRRDFFSVMGSADAKKRIRINWIALVAVVLLRLVLIIVSNLLYYGMPANVLFSRLPYLIFSTLTLAHLLLLFACSHHYRGLAAAALIIGAFAYWPLWNLFDIIGCIAHIVACVVVLINTLKLEKEYRAYLDRAFPGTAKK